MNEATLATAPFSGVEIFVTAMLVWFGLLVLIFGAIHAGKRGECERDDYPVKMLDLRRYCHGEKCPGDHLYFTFKITDILDPLYGIEIHKRWCSRTEKWRRK